MTWNYRICSETVGEGQFRCVLFTIREVYYNEDGEPNSWTADPIAPVGDTAEECAQAIDMMAGCLASGVLDLDELIKKLDAADG